MLLILCAFHIIRVDARTAVAQDGSSDYDYDLMVEIHADDEGGEMHGEDSMVENVRTMINVQL